MENKYTKYLNYCFVGYALSLPLSKAGISIFEASIFLLWLLEANWKNKFNLINNNLLSISILLFIAYNIISILWANTMIDGLAYIQRYKHLLIVLVLYTSLKKEYIQYLFSAFLLSMFLSEIVSYGIFFEWWHYKNVLPSDPSPFMSHIDYSILLSFVSMLLLNRFFNQKNNTRARLFYIIFFITVTANLFINGGKTGQIAFIILLLINIFFNIKNKIKAFLIFCSILFTTAFLAYNFSPTFQKRTLEFKNDIVQMVIKKQYNGTLSIRVALWTIGLENFKQHPIIGIGIGNEMQEKNVQYALKKHDITCNVAMNYKDSHNTFMTTLSQHGIIGLFMILFIFYAVVTLQFNTANYRTLNLLFFTSFIIWSMGNTTLHTMNALVYFALFAGIFNRVSKLEESKN